MLLPTGRSSQTNVLGFAVRACHGPWSLRVQHTSSSSPLVDACEVSTGDCNSTVEAPATTCSIAMDCMDLHAAQATVAALNLGHNIHEPTLGAFGHRALAGELSALARELITHVTSVCSSCVFPEGRAALSWSGVQVVSQEGVPGAVRHGLQAFRWQVQPNGSNAQPVNGAKAEAGGMKGGWQDAGTAPRDTTHRSRQTAQKLLGLSKLQACRQQASAAWPSICSTLAYRHCRHHLPPGMLTTCRRLAYRPGNQQC